MKNIILHSGAVQINESDLFGIHNPETTDTFKPIDHNRMLLDVKREVIRAGLSITGSSHAIDKGGNRYFGLLEIATSQQDYQRTIAIRNSHDKSFAAGIAAGSRVFVCDNLAFSGDVTFQRKHTPNIEEDLQFIIVRAVRKLAGYWYDMEHQYNRYKDRIITDHEVISIVSILLQKEIVGKKEAISVMQEYHTPSHPEFAESRNLWRLFNAVTEVKKGSNLFKLPEKTESLHGILDIYSRN